MHGSLVRVHTGAPAHPSGEQDVGTEERKMFSLSFCPGSASCPVTSGPSLLLLASYMPPRPTPAHSSLSSALILFGHHFPPSSLGLPFTIQTLGTPSLCSRRAIHLAQLPPLDKHLPPNGAPLTFPWVALSW